MKNNTIRIYDIFQEMKMLKAHIRLLKLMNQEPLVLEKQKKKRLRILLRFQNRVFKWQRN